MKTDIQSFREMLPISSGKPVMPNVPTRIVVSAKGEALMLERFVISNAGTEGGAGDWVINDIEIDGVSQIGVKNLSGALFSSRGVVVGGKRASSCLYFRDLDVVEQESAVAVTVTYVGSNPSGCPLFASIIGGAPPQRPTVLPIVTKNKLPPGVTTTITAVLDQPLEIGRLEIDNTGTNGGAADWVVNDICIDGTSQFRLPGKVPGDLFGTTSMDSFVKFHPGTRIELLITYIGSNESGCCLTARLLGTVVREDLQQPPRDVYAVVQSSDGTFDEEVVAHCDWRSSRAFGY